MSTKYNKDTLLELDFEPLALWSIEDGQLKYKPHKMQPQFEALCQIRNILYAFICGDEVLYIGKTTQGVKQRFLGYCNPGVTQRVNIKCSKKIQELLKQNKSVEIFLFFGNEKFQYGDFPINLAAGLEDNLIAAFNPPWNSLGKKKKATTESEDNEASAGGHQPPQDGLPVALPDDWRNKPHFQVNLQAVVNWEKGYMNIPAESDGFVAGHGSVVNLYLGSMENVVTNTISRKANPNGNARIVFGKRLAEWYQHNFKEDERPDVYIINPYTLFICAKAEKTS